MTRCWWMLSVLTLSLAAMVPQSSGQEPREDPRLVPYFDGERVPTITQKDSAVRRTAFQKFADVVLPPQRTRKADQGPSTLQKFNRNTKRLFAKTKTMLMPWNKEKTPYKKRNSAPFWSKTNKPPKTKKPLFPWLSKKPPKPTPPTLRDLVARPNP